MKRFLAIGGVIAGILLVFIGLVWMHLRRERPEYLIARLQHARATERDDLLMRLGLARGDLVALLIDAYSRPDADTAFRVQLLELLFRYNIGAPDERLAVVVQPALEDPAPEIRRAAVTGIVTYGQTGMQVKLADRVGDDDAHVRRQVYALFAAGGIQPHQLGAFGALREEQRSNLVARCAAQMRTETDPELAFLARSVVGRKIAMYCEQAIQAVGSADIGHAMDLLDGALTLDPDNQRAQIQLARLQLTLGDRETAIETARRHGALIEVPRLSAAPVIDGDPSDDIWQEAYTTDRFYHSTSDYVAKPTGGKSRCYIGHRDGRLYIAVLGFEEDLDQLVVRHMNRNDDVFKDDCVELIFSPENSETEFFQFIINPAGALMDNKSGDRNVNFASDYKARVFADRGYWAVEFAIDATELSPHPITPETIWSLNIFRVRIGAASEHGCIWPMYGGALFPGRYPLAIFK